MNIRDAIASGTRRAVALIGEGEAWEYALLTSALSTNPPTFGGWLELPARRASRRLESVSHDEKQRGWAFREVLTLTLYGSIELIVGDKVRSNGIEYHVSSQPQEGVAIRTLEVARKLPLTATADRGNAP